MKLEPRNKHLSSFSLASLTDIVLLLLIFFLLSSTYILQPGIKVKLPRSETAKVIDERNIVVTITREGTIYVGNEHTGLGNLAALLRRHVIHGAAQTFVIKADRKVPLELAVSVIDRIKAAGGERFLIATTQEEE